MEIETPLGHASTIEGLWAAAQRGRLPHALILSGPDGIGKFLAARWLAAGLLCEGGPGRPCGECGACRRVCSGGTDSNHPDMLVLDPVAAERESIPVDWIAEREGGKRESAHAFLRFKAFEGGWRVVLLRDADRMVQQAQNALLKVLEEPAMGTLLVLVTHRPGGLLQTVLSRCVRVGLDPLEPGDAMQVLAGEELVGSRAEMLARWSGGSPGAALRLSTRGAIELRGMIEGVLTGSQDPLAAGRAVWELEGEFPGSTPRAQARERARTLLDLALGVAGDLVRIEAGQDPESLRHGDLAGRLVANRLGAAQLVESLIRSRQDIDSNVSPEAVLDRALLAMEDVRRWKTLCAR